MSNYKGNGERKALEVKLTDRLLKNQYRMAHQMDDEAREGVCFGEKTDEEMAKMQKIINKNLSIAKEQENEVKFFEDELEDLYNTLDDDENEEDEFVECIGKEMDEEEPEEEEPSNDDLKIFMQFGQNPEFIDDEIPYDDDYFEEYNM